MTIKFGTNEMEYPGPELGELSPSDPITTDTAALFQRLEHDGYLFLPGLLDRADVMNARERILSFMSEKHALDTDYPVLDGAMPQGGRGVNVGGLGGISRSPELLSVLESPRLFDLFKARFGEEARTFDFKWLRAVGNEKYTGCHYDVVYMGFGSQRLHTVWIPFEDIEIERGTLAVCEGSHRLPGFERLRQTYGRMDVDRDLVEGWFSKDPREILLKFGGQWRTSPVSAGDVIVFGLWMMHASTTNTTNRWRLSCDVRYQPASEPADARWMGREPSGHIVPPDAAEGKTTSMADARKAWDI